MNYTDLQNRAAQLASFEGWTDAASAPDWPTLVNRAWHMFSTDAEIIIASASTAAVSGQLDYVIQGGPWKNFMDVAYAGVSLRRSTEEFERYANPAWRTQASGTPNRYVVSMFNTVTLVPPPNGSSLITVRGFKQGADMVLSTDIPGSTETPSNPIPEAYHEAIAVRAAWLQGVIYAQGPAMDRLQVFEQRYMEYVTKTRQELNIGAWRREKTQDP